MDDLTGTADERARQLASIVATSEPPGDWLLRQLELALAAWARDENELDIDVESKQDF